jgi:hypothetical protein
MKAATVYAITALSVIAGTIALVFNGTLHPFTARAMIGLSITLGVFIAFMPYHKGK